MKSLHCLQLGDAGEYAGSYTREVINRKGDVIAKFYGDDQDEADTAARQHIDAVGGHAKWGPEWDHEDGSVRRTCQCCGDWMLVRLPENWMKVAV